MSEELQKKCLEELQAIRARLGVLGNVLGPIVPESLAVLDGWTWRLDTTPARSILTRGTGPINIIDPIQNEIGWINSLSVIFSDPDARMKFASDNWTFESSPRELNLMGGLGPNNRTIFCPVYNPGSYFGPIYGIMALPSTLWPYTTNVVYQAQLPSSVLAPTCHIVSYSIGRHFLRDEKHFYETIFGEGEKQIRGTAQVPGRDC